MQPATFAQSVAPDDEQIPRQPPGAHPGVFGHAEAESCAQGVDVPVHVPPSLPAPANPPVAPLPLEPPPPLAPPLGLPSSGGSLSSEQAPSASTEISVTPMPKFMNEVCDAYGLALRTRSMVPQLYGDVRFGETPSFPGEGVSGGEPA